MIKLKIVETDDDEKIGNYILYWLNSRKHFCQKQINTAAKRCALAEKYAVGKCEKNRTRQHISGFGVEVLGSMSDEMKSIFQL